MVRVPASRLSRALSAKVLCAAIVASGCGGESRSPQGTGGGASESGGSSGTGVAGLGGSSTGGSGGGSAGAGTGGNAGAGGVMGDGGAAGGGGVSGAGAAAGQEGNAGESGAGGSAGVGTGGLSGTGGMAGGAGGGESGGASGTAGASASGGVGGAGGAGETVEYRACVVIGGVTRILVHRLDRVTSTCVQLTFHEETTGCPLELTNNGWCLSGARINNDVAACEARQVLQGTTPATSVTGDFTIFAADATPSVDLDLTLEFEAGAGLPPSVRAEVAGCRAACSSICQN
jgi:hypothetical protein